MMSLALDQRAEVDHDALRFVALAADVAIIFDQLGKLPFILLAVALELLGDFLLHDKGFEGVVALLLRAVEAVGGGSQLGSVLLNGFREAVVLFLMLFDLGFEVRGFFGELGGEGLEFLELRRRG